MHDEIGRRFIKKGGNWLSDSEIIHFNAQTFSVGFESNKGWWGREWRCIGNENISTGVYAINVFVIQWDLHKFYLIHMSGTCRALRASKL